uniref:Uncharacterized protein n=1 Tax=Rhizobium leguminosarum TaxID=384 RepID=A0A179BE25_RHILE|nr:hypothetical protein A4U53_06400 [Rhizobium leguminosarum]
MARLLTMPTNFSFLALGLMPQHLPLVHTQQMSGTRQRARWEWGGRGMSLRPVYGEKVPAGG